MINRTEKYWKGLLCWKEITVKSLIPEYCAACYKEIPNSTIPRLQIPLTPPDQYLAYQHIPFFHTDEDHCLIHRKRAGTNFDIKIKNDDILCKKCFDENFDIIEKDRPTDNLIVQRKPVNFTETKTCWIWYSSLEHITDVDKLSCVSCDIKYPEGGWYYHICMDKICMLESIPSANVDKIKQTVCKECFEHWNYIVEENVSGPFVTKHLKIKRFPDFHGPKSARKI